MAIRFNPLVGERNIFNSFSKALKQRYYTAFAEGGDFVLPSVSTFANEFDGFVEQMIKNYDESYPDLADKVEVHIKVFQAAADEGFFITADGAGNKNRALYTNNKRNIIQIAKQLEQNFKYSSDPVGTKNLEGAIHAVRVDLSFEKGEEVVVKLTNPTFKNWIFIDPSLASDKSLKKLKEGEELVQQTIIPLNVIWTFQKTIELFLRKGWVLETKHVYDGVQKVRYITENDEILKKFVESGKVKARESLYFPAQAFSYSPSVGAPATSAQLTRLEPLFLDHIRRVNPEELNELVEPAKDTLEESLEYNIISIIFNSLWVQDPDKASQFGEMLLQLDSVKEQFESFEGGTQEEFKERVLRAIRNLNDEDLGTVKTAFGLSYVNYLDHYSSILNKFEPVPVPETVSEMYRLLDEGAYRITILNKNSKLSVVQATNSEKILSQIYGKDYFEKYESDGVKRRRALKEKEEGTPEEELLEKYHLESLELTERQQNYKSNPDTVTVRKVFAVYDRYEITDFYRSVKLDSIISLVRIG